MSGGGDDNDLSAIAWPGFVDILSSVVIMFVFFVLLVSVALYFHVITYKAKVQKDAVNLAMEAVSEVQTKDNKMLEQFYTDAPESAQKQEEQVTQADLILELKQKNEALEETIEDLQEKLFQSRSQFSESVEQNSEARIEDRTFIIFFGPDSITLTPKTKDDLKAFLAEVQGEVDLKTASASVTAGVSPRAPTQVAARKLSVARMLNARNVFLDTEIDLKKMNVELAGQEAIDGNYSWVKIVIEEGQ